MVGWWYIFASLAGMGGMASVHARFHGGISSFMVSLSPLWPVFRGSYRSLAMAIFRFRVNLRVAVSRVNFRGVINGQRNSPLRALARGIRYLMRREDIMGLRDLLWLSRLVRANVG